MPLNFNPVGWFEIPTADINRAKAFYESVFDVELDMHEMPAADGSVCKMGWFPMQPDAKGAAGSLVHHETYTPSTDGVAIYFSVEDIVATLAKVESSGGKTLIPETSIGEHGFFAWIQDSEGNRIALHRRADT